MARSQDIKTPLGIASFTADLFKPRERENGTKTYGLTVLFDKTTDLTPLKNLAAAVAKEQWGEKAISMIQNGVIKSPFLDGDGPQGVSKKSGERHPGYAGRVFIRCTSGADYRPKVFDAKLLPVTDAEGCPSGSQIYAVVNAYTWENEKNGKGISFGVSLVQVVKKAQGEEVLGGSGGPAPEGFFEKLEDTGDAPAETKSGAGAAGLFG